MIKKDETNFIATGAIVIGDVTLGENTSVWYNAVIRGDGDTIVIGRNSNIQDLAMVHVDEGFPVHIGDGVTVGHSAIIHGCTIGDNTLIGMGATVLNGAKIGKGCLIGANALVTQGMEIPDYSLVVGMPAVIKRTLTPEEVKENQKNAQVYVEEAKKALHP
jgi:carbonic anhydrase/acetyltransferase-like protein (isoleucine patch superfamily)